VRTAKLKTTIRGQGLSVPVSRKRVQGKKVVKSLKDSIRRETKRLLAKSNKEKRRGQ
jgi:hypothetical protein